MPVPRALCCSAGWFILRLMSEVPQSTPPSAVDREVIGPEPVPLRRYLNPVAAVAHLWSCRHLIGQFALRDVLGRYRGSRLGFVWSFFTPLLMLTVYTFIFGIVLEVRFRGAVPESRWEFALTLFSGLILFAIFAECITRSPTLVIGNPAFVKRTIFPLEILPASVVGAGLIQAAASLLVLLAGKAALLHSFSWTIVCLPLVLLPVVLLGVGLGWMLASLGTFLRDTHHAAAIATQALLFLTPILYPLQRAPEPLRAILRLNPLTVVVDSGRRVIMWNQWPDWTGLAVVTVVAAVVAQLGYACFMKAKRGFADVV